MDEAERGTVLHYGEPVPWHRRRGMRRWAWAGLGLIVLASALVWGPVSYRRAVVAYWERQCARYTAPPGQVVFDDDPQRMAGLAGPDWIAQTDPVSGARLAALRAVRPWTGANPDGRLPAAVLFLHERTSPAGLRGLVVVEARINQTGTPLLALIGLVRKGGRDQYALIQVMGEWAGQPTRLYAGQPDPIDASHFTIPWERGGQRGLIDGWLLDSGGVKLEARPGR